MTNFQPNQCEVVWKINSNNEKKNQNEHILLFHWSEAFYKNKNLVIGKKFRFEIIFQNGELGHFTKRRINRIRTKTFVITNSMKGNILWGDIYKWTYFLDCMLPTSCSFLNILFYCQKSTPRKLFLA